MMCGPVWINIIIKALGPYRGNQMTLDFMYVTGRNGSPAKLKKFLSLLG
jgi:hypothetical protein